MSGNTVESMEAAMHAYRKMAFDERDRRLAAEDIIDRVIRRFPEKKLLALARGYRLQYPLKETA